jgi:hypothetical protein
MNPRIFLNHVAWALHWAPSPSILHLDSMMFSEPSPAGESWPTVVLRERTTGVQWTRPLDPESFDRVRSPEFES